VTVTASAAPPSFSSLGSVGRWWINPAGDLVTELGVVGGVEDERVPSLVYVCGRGQTGSRIARAGYEERPAQVR
jgi:hypothetical protein